MAEALSNPGSGGVPDQARTAAIKEFITSYQAVKPGVIWPGTLLARDTYIDSTGVFRRGVSPGAGGGSADVNQRGYRADLDDLAVCDRIAALALALQPGPWLVEASEADVEWFGFSNPGEVGGEPPAVINDVLIARRMAGAISPIVRVTVWSLEELVALACDAGREEDAAAIEDFVGRFCALEGLTGHVLVQIGSADDAAEFKQMPAGVDGTACVFARLIVGLTERGGIAGVIGAVVQT